MPFDVPFLQTVMPWAHSPFFFLSGQEESAQFLAGTREDSRKLVMDVISDLGDGRGDWAPLHGLLRSEHAVEGLAREVIAERRR